MDFYEIFRTGRIWDKEQSWLIFIFSGSIVTKLITQKLVNGFQWHFQDMLDTEQQNKWLDCHAQLD